MEQQPQKYADVNPEVENLLQACAFGDIKIIKEKLQLLKNKADINRKGRGGYNALQMARAKNNPAAVECLLQAGANANEKDCLGFGSLQLACWRKQMEIVKLLLKYGADINQTDSLGLTPIELASATHDDELSRLLQEHIK